MLRDSAIDLLMGRLGQRRDDSSNTMKNLILKEMVFVQENILEGNGELPWFLLSEKAEAVTVKGEERVALPADFLLEYEDSALVRVLGNGNEKVLIRDDWDLIKYKVLGEGAPTHYDIVGEYYLLRPVPDDVYTLRMRYYQRDASLDGTYGDSNNIENKWLKYASDWLIAETGVIIAAQQLQSTEMASMFAQQAHAAKRRVLSKSVLMAETSKNRVLGG